MGTSESFAEWTQETTRSVTRRAGHFLPMILVVTMPLGIASAVLMWFALHEVVMISDPEAQTFEIQNFEWSIAAQFLIAAQVASILASFLFAGAVAHHVLPPADDDEQHDWSASLRMAVSRAPRILGYSLLRLLIYLVPVLGLFFLFAAAVAVSPVFLIPLLLLFQLLAYLWLRLSFVGVSAAVGPRDVNPLKASWELTQSTFFPVLGRLLLLLLVGFAGMFTIVFVIGQPFMLLTGGGATGIQPGQDVIKLSDALGSSWTVPALSAFFSTFGAGFRDIVLATGVTKLYQRFRGPVDEPLLVVASRGEDNSDETD